MKSETKILIVEHDDVDLEMLREELQKSSLRIISEVVDTESAYKKMLAEFIPDIILSDFSFPSFNGLAAFEIKQSIAPDTPFIFVSGAIGEEKSIELIKAGVTDYALKDKLYTLNPKIIRALREAKEKQRKREAEERLALSEKKLARAQQLAHMGNWELDFSTDIIKFSDEACRIYGLDPCKNQQSLKKWLAFIHYDDVSAITTIIDKSRNEFADFAMSFRIILDSLTVRYMYAELKIEMGNGPTPAGFFGFIQDVTEKTLLENNLALERQAGQVRITSAILTAQENERADIANELHDNLIQMLGAAKLYVELSKTDEINRIQFLETCSAYLVNVIGKIMKISRTLSSPGTQVGLINCIKILIADLIRINPVNISFKEDDIHEEYLDENLQLTIFRIVQEQLNNIIKHADATQASISLRKKNKEIILLITDNGKGSDISKQAHGVGIRNIKSRAELHKGSVVIASKPGKGYELKVILSLNNYLTAKDTIVPMQAQ